LPGKARFTSNILPKWARRSKRLDALLLVLYLRGISTGDCQAALSALLGPDAPNLSPGVISRLTAGWETGYDAWRRRDLSARRYVYIWADGVYLQARMAPEIATGDGAMGFWKALDAVFPGTRHQRCWFHKISNVLNKVPKSMAPAVKSDLQDIHHAEPRADALQAIETFKEKYGAKYAPAVTCLTKDIDALLAFYDFPAEHWDHLRTSNPIESVFATVRHRTVRAKGALSQQTVKLMVFKLVQAASKTWRRLNGRNQLPQLIEGVTFTDGVAVVDTTETSAA